MSSARIVPLLLAVGLLPVTAFAHPGHGIPDFTGGLLHPLTGLDHLLAMVAVGWWSITLASARSGAGAWRVPLAFAAGLLAGALAGVAGLQVPATELLVAASLLVLGGLLLQPQTMGTATASLLAASLAFVHGQAHGAELPVTANAALWLAGMVAATLLLHLAGAALALGTQRSPRLRRIAGALLAVAGGTLMLAPIGL